jgi:hypothetical protein
MPKVITKYFSRKIANAVQAELSSNIYYFAFSKHSEYADEDVPEDAINTTEYINKFQRELILGKRIKASDVTNLLDRHSWQSGTIYTQYDDTDQYMYDKEFYVINGTENVFKCLYNNNDGESIVEPTTISSSKFQTADGYIWKYMYTVETANNNRFSTSAYIPVDANATVSSAASNGSIDIILIETAGSGYRGYITGSISQVISNSIFKVVSTSALSTDNYFYNDAAFYITVGTGISQLTTVSSYIVNSSGYFIYTANLINSPALDTTSEFRIAPQIRITGDGTGAKAVCTVNTISGSYFIETIDVLSTGSNYSYADVNIEANPSVGSNATARAIIPPKGGHGYDVATELGCYNVGVSVFFSNSEYSTISTDVPFRQATIISYPYKYTAPNTFATFTTTSGISNTNETITISNANTHFLPGDMITYVCPTSNTALSGFVNNEMYFVKTSNTTTVTLSDTYEGTTKDLTSAATGETHFLYTTRAYGANTFNALTTLNITGVTGTFARNETVTGTTSLATAKIAFANSTVVKLGAVTGTFLYTSNGYASEPLSGATSFATATISSINNPDIQPYTSSVLYIDNVEKITRSSVDFEQAYLILTL